MSSKEQEWGKSELSFSLLTLYSSLFPFPHLSFLTHSFFLFTPASLLLTPYFLLLDLSETTVPANVLAMFLWQLLPGHHQVNGLD